MTLRSHPRRFEIQDLATEILRQHSGLPILTMLEAITRAIAILGAAPIRDALDAGVEPGPITTWEG